MAFFHCNFFSQQLGINTAAYVILPQKKTAGQIGMQESTGEGLYKTLYLLHGMTDDYSIWHRRTSIERYACSEGVAVVMPSADRSYYTDMEKGKRFYSFVSEELPRLMQGFFPLSHAREDTYIAGNSMGAYGAMKIALRNPERYAAVGAFSGTLDIACIAQTLPEITGELQGIFGKDAAALTGSVHDLRVIIAEGVAAGVALPRVYLCCGEQDERHAINLDFHRYCDTMGLHHQFSQSPGVHDWAYWDAVVQDFLQWL